MDLKDKILKYFNESMKIKSFSNTESEQNIENYLLETIGKISYFKENITLFGKSEIQRDIKNRSNIWALLKSDVKDTVILFHHHDTVDIENFGNLKDIAFDSERLKKNLIIKSNPELNHDIKSNNWIFGRGSCDMKSALALQLAVLEEYSQKTDRKVNLLYLSVADEETYSAGMRSAVNLLIELKNKYDLNYILAIDSEPFESDSEYIKTLYLGTVGKLMPVIVTQGVVSHIKEPLKGINAASLMAKVVSELDLNEKLSETVLVNTSPLPTISYLRDLKEIYNVTTVQRAATYFSILDLTRTPEEDMNIIMEICKKSADDYFKKYIELRNKYKVDFEINNIKVLSYSELLKLCKEKKGYDYFIRNQLETTKEKFKNNMSFQDIVIDNIKECLEFYDSDNAYIIIAIAPPYYPAVNSRNIKSDISINKLTDLYNSYLKDRNFSINVEEHFMGICDISYCAIEKDEKCYEAVLNSMAISDEIYELDFNKIKELNIPGINLGPWGKDLHKNTERVYKEDMLKTIPEFLLYLLDNIDSTK